MSDGIDVTPEVLAASAQTVMAAAQDMGNQLTQLQSTVTSGNPWGSDEQGSLFGMLYNAVLGHALETLGSHAQLLGSAAVGLDAWAQQVARTEQGTTQQLNSLGQQVGG